MSRSEDSKRAFRRQRQARYPPGRATMAATNKSLAQSNNCSEGAERLRNEVSNENGIDTAAPVGRSTAMAHLPKRLRNLPSRDPWVWQFLCAFFWETRAYGVILGFGSVYGLAALLWIADWLLNH